MNRLSNTKILFFGGFDAVLKELNEQIGVDHVFQEEEKPSPSVQHYCDRNDIHLDNIQSLSDIDLTPYDSESLVGVVASFGLIFTRPQINNFLKLYNFHPGCIYKNRGKHPLPNAIAHGQKTMAVTLHQITDEKIDAGELVARIEFPIDYNTSYKKNSDRMLGSLKYLTNYLCDGLANDYLPSFPLDPDSNSYYPPLEQNLLRKIMHSETLGEWK
jgi:methionyl-tRNA formyltransferase